MPRTYFADFVKDDGRPITVEYNFASGGETTYSPLYGADGGEGCEVEIVDVMPNTEDYEFLCRELLDLSAKNDPACMAAEVRDRLAELSEAMGLAKAAVALTDGEHERMCAWLTENHAFEPDEDDFVF